MRRLEKVGSFQEGKVVSFSSTHHSTIKINSAKFSAFCKSFITISTCKLNFKQYKRDSSTYCKQLVIRLEIIKRKTRSLAPTHFPHKSRSNLFLASAHDRLSRSKRLFCGEKFSTIFFQFKSGLLGVGSKSQSAAKECRYFLIIRGLRRVFLIFLCVSIIRLHRECGSS